MVGLPWIVRLTDDEANHRVALLSPPGLKPPTDKGHETGLHHSAFEFSSFDIWLNNYIRLGVTASSNDSGTDGNSLRGADVMLRKSADSWVKLQGGKSNGLDSTSFYSNDGGFGFTSYNPNSFANARSWRPSARHLRSVSWSLSTFAASSPRLDS